MSYIKYVRAAHLFNFDFILFSSFCVLCPMLLLYQYYPFMFGLLIFSPVLPMHHSYQEYLGDMHVFTYTSCHYILPISNNALRYLPSDNIAFIFTSEGT